MARVAIALSCTAEQRAELMTLARSRTEEARLVERAKIVLACLEGKHNDAVGRELGVRPNTVGLWRKRFAAAGLAGLRDRVRPGKTPKSAPAGSAPTGIAAPPRDRPAGTGRRWRRPWGSPTMRYGACCARRGCNCAAGGRGASAPTNNLPPKPPISSGST